MGKKEPITQADVQRAIKIVQSYRGINISYLHREDQEAIIRGRYGDSVRGIPVSTMSKEQVYTVAKSIYDRSLMIVYKLKSGSLEIRMGYS